MQGFKSFADRVSITFDHNIVGVVGPNGCGKSNIADAIRWVLGEQSIKSLRGTHMTDVIFTGSEVRRKVNFAEVSLVFDNHDRSFDIAYDEIEITRRLHRENAEGEYLINKSPCRLKDILDLTMDSGIGRDSLSIISQGSISDFAESKPIDRRAIFEEAAGVSKYRKRKMDALSKLEKTDLNLERMNDIYLELQKQVVPLKRAAQKALIYQEKKKRLQEIEITVVANLITKTKLKADENNRQLFDLQSKEAVLEAAIQVNENNNMLSKTELHQLDRQIQYGQDDLIKLINEIQTLETRKIEIDEKHKYQFEVGNPEEKTKELKHLLQEAKVEYEDRLLRLQNLNNDLTILNQKNIDLSRALIEQNTQVEESNIHLQRVSNRLEVLQNLQNRPFMTQQGVQAVISAKQNLIGVYGVVGQLMIATSGYEEAISVALGGALYNVVTKDEASARQAITFLKRNESGRATFLPLTVLQDHHLRREDAVVCSNSEGYLGVASQFVSCENTYEEVKNSLLGNVIVVDTLENGNALANLVNYQYKLVTLDGDVIHKGGSMTGGKVKDNASPLTMVKEINELSIQQNTWQQTLAQRQDKFHISLVEKTDNESLLIEKRIASASLEPVVDAKKAKYERLLHDLNQLSPQSQQDNPLFEDPLISQLNTAYAKRDTISTQLKSFRETRLKVGDQQERREQQIRQQRRELNEIQSTKRTLEIDQARQHTNLENMLNRLSQDYQMTYEYALAHPLMDQIENADEEVVLLRQAIEELGSINMLAPEEYQQVNERYETMKQQYEELKHSKDKIVELIKELDELMIKQFKEMLDRINLELPAVFQALFGGGTASLTLDDPSDYLNSGIDIHVQPPGKSIQNIRLFSGGEKSLIAISVLFAILKARHVPLCIFDEIEAALDQSNVDKFARYLKIFSQNTQFLVVTHRPGTMSQCDVLYGVTMGSSGVSQMLKVRLTDAVELIDGATA